MKLSVFLFLLSSCIFLGACDDIIVGPPVTPRVLDFNAHPSVLRGTWSGAVANYPTSGQETTLELTNLAPSCKEVREGNQCYFYTITGQIQLGDDPLATLEGTGFAGGGNIYALTSPVPDTGFDITFESQGQTWYLEGNYRPRNADETTDPVQSSFEGALRPSDLISTFSFRLAFHSNP
jgi:hypothetical protein